MKVEFTPAQDALRAELREELSRGRIVETSLREDGFILDGLCDHGNQTVYIDPAPAVVETLIHELMHRRWPDIGRSVAHPEH